MIHALLIREPEQPSAGTPGSLFVDGKFVCYTLEEFWKNNERRISCVPAGTYHCIKHSGSFKNVWRLLNVPNRTAVLIHAGNTLADTEGCILVGLARMETGILKSKAALDKLRSLIPGEFTLEIRNP